MRVQLENRLQALLSEYDKGQQRLRELDTQRSGLSDTLLRISGAILVLQEELAADQPVAPGDGHAGSHTDAQPADHPDISPLANTGGHLR